MSSTRLSMGYHDVWITVGGKEVEHFGMEIKESTKEISCWIPPEAGQEFSICFQKTTVEFASAVDLYLDGHCSRRLTVPAMLNCPQFISYTLISSTEARDFRFGLLEITDDDTYLGSPDSVRSIGEIKVTLHKATNLCQRDAQRFASPPETKKVHERSKKALSHQINYGEIKRLNDTPLFSSFVRHEALGTFIFRYRPLAMLQANGIAPRSPSPSPIQQPECPRPSTPVPPSRKRKASEVKQESEDEDESIDVEAREKAILDRLSAFQAEIDKLRVEKADLDRIRSGKRARREEGSSRTKVKEEPKTYFTPGEIIDLT